MLATLALSSVAQSSLIRVGLFTPLKNDEHPCVAENLKVKLSIPLCIWKENPSAARELSFFNVSHFLIICRNLIGISVTTMLMSFAFRAGGNQRMMIFATWRIPAHNLFVIMRERPVSMGIVSGQMSVHAKLDGEKMCWFICSPECHSYTFSIWNLPLHEVKLCVNLYREGHLCNQCVPLPGCEHGSCENAFDCNCDTDASGNNTLWEGAFCDRRKRKQYILTSPWNIKMLLSMYTYITAACPESLCDPKHGQCFEPLACTCFDGWTGEDCKTCRKLPGCVNGDCEKGRPNTCECREGWTGHLCDIPVCR